MMIIEENDWNDGFYNTVEVTARVCKTGTGDFLEDMTICFANQFDTFDIACQMGYNVGVKYGLNEYRSSDAYISVLSFKGID